MKEWEKKRAKKQGKMKAGKKSTERSDDHDTTDADELFSSENEDVDASTRPGKKTKVPTKLTAYMDIISPPRTLKGKLTTNSRSPFFFTVETTHEEFLQLVANCGVAANYAPTIGSINQSQLTWKQSVPASDKKKPLSNLDSYQAMITKLQLLLEKGKDTTIILSSPPLARVARNVCHIHVPCPPNVH